MVPVPEPLINLDDDNQLQYTLEANSATTDDALIGKIPFAKEIVL